MHTPSEPLVGASAPPAPPDRSSSPAPPDQSPSPAPFERRPLTVITNEQLGAYRVLKAEDPDGPPPSPGQFAMLAAAERWGAGEDERPFLARAFSYARWLTDRPSRRSAIGGEAHFLLEDVGPGTRRLCELEPGERLLLLGPLGRGFRAPAEGRRALLVGGGVGIAPLAIWQDALAGKAGGPLGESAAVGVLLGFRDGARARGARLFESAEIATDDGSLGRHGLVTELLAERLNDDPHATVYACGPAPMLEAVRAICARCAVPAQLALESPMACGFGACHGCVVPTRDGGYLRVCVDGPVFDAGLFDRIDAHAGAPT